VDERARELIAEARYELDSPKSIDGLGLHVRTYNILRINGISTLSDLTSRSEEDLLALENFGPACLGDVQKELSYYGLKLARQGDPTPVPSSLFQARVAALEVALRAYRSALRSGEGESEQLRDLARAALGNKEAA